MHSILSYINSASEENLRLLLVSIEKKLKKPSEAALTSGQPMPPKGSYLGPEQLAAATESFLQWIDAASTAQQKQSRCRIWLIFLLIRYGGLRLKEVLNLECNDIDTASGKVSIRGSSARNVHLPENVTTEVVRLLALPELLGVKGKVFDIDQGYLRRKFYERAKECNIPRELFNPRMVRYSRAVELLNGGLPLQAVYSFMGQKDLDVAGGFVERAVNNDERMVYEYLTREVKMKTSARNAFTGKVVSLRHEGILNEVVLETLSGMEVVAVITEESASNLKLHLGSIVTATVKAPWVIIAQEEDEYATSARNRFAGKIVGLKTSEIAAEVVVELADKTLVCALITDDSVKKLNLQKGMQVQVMFKAFSVILNVE